MPPHGERRALRPANPGWDGAANRGKMSGLLGTGPRPRSVSHALCAPLAQSAERFHGKEKVVSSILTGGSVGRQFGSGRASVRLWAA